MRQIFEPISDLIAKKQDEYRLREAAGRALARRMASKGSTFHSWRLNGFDSLDQYVDRCWQHHADDAQAVVDAVLSHLNESRNQVTGEAAE